MQSRRDTPGVVDAYIRDATVALTDVGLVSLVLFGSTSTGGHVAGLSDVDLLVVLDDQRGDAIERARDVITELEKRHGLGKAMAAPRGFAGRLQRFADVVTANVRSFFVCTRGDLLSGDPARILSIPRAQALFVDRAAIPSIVTSARTVWGEDLLPRVPLPPIRRIDVAKAFFGLFNHALFCVVAYPLLPGATRYAMDALKRSVHNCYFCDRLEVAPLRDEVAYFQSRDGRRRTLDLLLELRMAHRPSVSFVMACPMVIAGLHLRTALRGSFPRAVRARG